MQTNSNPIPETIEANLSAIGSKIADSATQLKIKAVDAGRSAIDSAVNIVSDAANDTARYVTTSNTGTMLADINTLIKKRPAPYLLVAATLGFLIGRSWHMEYKARRSERSAYLK